MSPISLTDALLCRQATAASAKWRQPVAKAPANLSSIIALTSAGRIRLRLADHRKINAGNLLCVSINRKHDMSRVARLCARSIRAWHLSYTSRCESVFKKCHSVALELVGPGRSEAQRRIGWFKGEKAPLKSGAPSASHRTRDLPHKLDDTAIPVLSLCTVLSDVSHQGGVRHGIQDRVLAAGIDVAAP